MRKYLWCLCVVFLLSLVSGVVIAAEQEDPLAAWRESLKHAQEQASQNQPKQPTVYEQGEEPDPAYLEAIKQRDKEDLKSFNKNSGTDIKEPDEPVALKGDVERLCLSGYFCMNSDFSDMPDAKNFVYSCEQFEREYPYSSDLSRKAHSCFSFLLGFGEALTMESFIHHGADKKRRPLCIGGAAEEMPRKYLSFMKRNPDLLAKYFSYGVFRFFEETFPCADK